MNTGPYIFTEQFFRAGLHFVFQHTVQMLASVSWLYPPLSSAIQTAFGGCLVRQAIVFILQLQDVVQFPSTLIKILKMFITSLNNL